LRIAAGSRENRTHASEETGAYPFPRNYFKTYLIIDEKCSSRSSVLPINSLLMRLCLNYSLMESGKWVGSTSNQERGQSIYCPIASQQRYKPSILTYLHV
ncbi:hypothetical protein CEXT_346751, partial [Caerostris extrusa]